jgi:hypothetical protein
VRYLGTRDVGSWHFDRSFAAKFDGSNCIDIDGPFIWPFIASQRIFAERVQEHGAVVAKVKADMAAGVEVSQTDKNLLKQAVRMQPEDVGKIVFGVGELDEDRLPHPDSPIAKFFTPEKIGHAALHS